MTHEPITDRFTKYSEEDKRADALFDKFRDAGGSAAEIAALKAMVEAADALAARLASEPLEFGSSRGKHNIIVLEGLLAGYGRARAKLNRT